MKKVVVDCDPGQDDAIALLLALASPEDLEVLAGTTVAGNVAERACNRNARALLAAVDRGDVPVHSGCSRPFSGARHRVDVELDGAFLPGPHRGRRRAPHRPPGQRDRGGRSRSASLL